jgi:hypothetical protein
MNFVIIIMIIILVISLLLSTRENFRTCEPCSNFSSSVLGCGAQNGCKYIPSSAYTTGTGFNTQVKYTNAACVDA